MANYNAVTKVTNGEMYDSRRGIYDGIGSSVRGALTVEEAFNMANLDWTVKQDTMVRTQVARQIINDVKVAVLEGRDTTSIIHRLEEMQISGYKANYRELDDEDYLKTGDSVLGVVKNRYKVVQNREGLDFLNSLIGSDIICETAGSLFGGEVVWFEGRMEDRILCDEVVTPYIVFSNSHNGKSSVSVAMTPHRVICANTLNLALRTSPRRWSCSHMGDISAKLHEARTTLSNANAYMNALEEEFGELKRIKMDEDKVWEYLKLLFPIDGSETAKKEDWMKNARLGVYNAWNAPDLADREKSAFRFVNAVSDFATHSEPMRKTKNYQENLMWKTANGNPLIDKAYELVGALR